MEQLNLELLQKQLNIRFQDEAMLLRALTHRSMEAEQRLPSNERLEFLGDAVVGLVIGETYYQLFPDANEGTLAKLRAFTVSEARLSAAARQCGIAEFVLLSPTVENTGGRARNSILSDAFEAVVGAVYLDQGLTVAAELVRRLLAPAIAEAQNDTLRGDYKSALQEHVQSTFQVLPQYKTIRETGQDHDKTFLVEVYLRGVALGTGSGKSKKEAEQLAAREAIKALIDNIPLEIPVDI